MTEYDFIPGQRWVCETELDMGLGTVLSTEHRTVTMAFLATGETRTYAKQSAPLTRVEFAPGDTVLDHDGEQLKVNFAEDLDGLKVYQCTASDGSRLEILESQLSHFIQLNRPIERLFTHQIDANKWFELRYQTLQHINRLAHSRLRGLTGVRTSLIPHQLYIANEVANRYAPRVLLADEVGLGKTIEAGLILHQQLLTEQARRVLIIVPDSLVHQWLVEMLRRFNLRFSIFDEERCQAIEENNEQDNPFHTEQLVLCSLSFITQQDNRFQQALAGDWDLIVVDEAHHLQWSPTESSPEYTVIEHLAAKTKGVLLLTATPEQLGKAGHFARLRLLDPDRFPDFESFEEEEEGYKPIADVVDRLLNDQPLNDSSYTVLKNTIAEGDNQELLNILKTDTSDNNSKAKARHELVNHLLDRHGTGRVLFRNTRAAVKGFSDRKVNAYPLPLPVNYVSSYEVFFAEHENTAFDEQILLCPEKIYATCNADNSSIKNSPRWTDFDPRIPWLLTQLNTLKPEKVLVITANSTTALDIAQALKALSGIHAAVFHEGLSIIERDRAAAHFADTENGGQVLICSEIGSEGRNFQFAHHLVMFDLPLNPDLLEQRIGRLDRIGQTETIEIHVPYLEDSPQALMFEWYHQGLSAFEKTCPAGNTVFTRIKPALCTALCKTINADEKQSQLIQALVQETKTIHKELNAALQQGRDRLLEYNSCIPGIANKLRDTALKQDKSSVFYDYMNTVFDCIGVETEIHRTGSYIIRPGSHIHAHIPGLADDGMTVTFNREIALANEDMQFISWEHPLTVGVMEMIIGGELGNTTLSAIKSTTVRPGSMLVECVYLLETISSRDIPYQRYLPPTTIRIVVDQDGKDYSHLLAHSDINASIIAVDAETAKQVVQAQATELKAMLDTSESMASTQSTTVLNAAHRQATQQLQTEIDRLKALRQVNPNVRADEIQYFEEVLSTLNEVLGKANVRLEAVRVIVAT